MKVTCALKWARKLPRKTETYESAKCVPCNTCKCTHNGFVSDLLKWALKCGFYATGPWLCGVCVSNKEVISLNLLLPGPCSLCILWLQSRLSVFHGYFCFLTLSRVFSVASLCVVSLNWPEAQDNRPSPEIPTREPCKFVGSHTSLCRWG